MFKNKERAQAEEEVVSDIPNEGGQATAQDAESTEPKEESASAKSKSEIAEEEALNVRFMRLQADFANYKKRVEKEKSDIYRNANERLMESLLPVIDNFERALDHAEESPKEKFVEGVELVMKNLLTVLESSGLKEIEALNVPFDHNVHHAVLTEPCEENSCGIVTGVLQKGYKLNEKVIRPSMVKVSE